MGVLEPGEKSEEEKRISRRRLLASGLAFAAVGAGLVIFGGADKFAHGKEPSPVANLQAPPQGGSGAATVQSSTPVLQADSATSTSVISSGSVKVKVMYFQMPLVVGTTEEYLSLPSPAVFRDLLASVLEKHPALSPMVPAMMILIDGVPAKPGAPLIDGDEVDFIPATAGG